APSGALAVFSDCIIVAFNVSIQFVESGIFQFLSYILSVQEDAALDQLCHAEAVKRTHHPHFSNKEPTVVLIVVEHANQEVQIALQLGFLSLNDKIQHLPLRLL